MPQESSVSPFRALRAASPTDRNRTEARLDHRAAASPRVNACRRDIILVPPTIPQATKRSKPSLRPVRLGGRVARRFGEELGAATRTAEVVFDSVHLGGVTRARDGHAHAAHRIDRFAR